MELDDHYITINNIAFQNFVRIKVMLSVVIWVADFLKYADKDFSFVDCLSFAIIEDEKIDYALSFDHHFKLYHFAHPIKILP